MINALESSSMRPYLIRALYEWCTDNGLTPYAVVQVDDSVQVPREYVKNGEIVLNIGFDATNLLKLGNEFIEFKARFAGVVREIIIPIDRVLAIYARENGQGMVFPASTQDADTAGTAPEPRYEAQTDDKIVHLVVDEGDPQSGDAQPDPQDDPPKPPPRSPEGGARPALKRVK